MIRRAGAVLALLAVALLAAGCGDGDRGSGDSGSHGRLVVSAAASLQAAFTAYGKSFADADAKFSFAGSDVLGTQIARGAKPDVFASANTTIPDRLNAAGYVETPVRFAANELVLAKRAGNDMITSLQDIAKKGVRIAIGSTTVPVGTYTQTVLDRLQPAERKAILANVRTEEPDVTGIVGKLRQGAVDAGFLYKTDVRATNGKLQMIKLAPELAPVVNYSAAIVKGAHNPEAARLFIYGLIFGSGRKALLSAGFAAPSQ